MVESHLIWLLLNWKVTMALMASHAVAFVWGCRYAMSGEGNEA